MCQTGEHEAITPLAWWESMAVVGFAMMVFLVQVFVQRMHFAWDPDSALYILHAQNIIRGLPYAATGYVFNPLNPIHPAAYPPGLPLWLAPFLAVDGINPLVLKCAIVLSFSLFLVLFHRLARRYLAPAGALVTVLLVGCNPLLWNFAASIYAEYPFLLLAIAGLLIADRQVGTDCKIGGQGLLRSATAGFLLGLAAATRSVGILLPLAVIGAALPATFRYGSRPLVAAVIVAAVAGLTVFGLRFVFPYGVGTYLRYFHDYDWTALPAAAWLYLRTIPFELFGLWTIHGLNSAKAPLLVLAWIVSISVLCLALIGFVVSLRRVPAIFEVFFTLYAVLIVVYPIREELARYALPLYPMLILYAAVGLAKIERWIDPRLYRILGATAIALVVLVYGAVMIGTRPATGWVWCPDGQDLFAAIRDQTPAEAVILADEPTTIALFTQRRAAIWPKGANDHLLHAYARTVGAEFIVRRRDAGGPSGAAPLDPSARLYANDAFVLERLSGGEPPSAVGDD